MGRKVATQVHNAATRLMQGKLLQQPPLWYSAVAQYPPLPLPPRQAVKRSAFDLPKGTLASDVDPEVRVSCLCDAHPSQYSHRNRQKSW